MATKPCTAPTGSPSDGLEDGQVVSGVGGQYNFVAQAFALEGARAIITLNAARKDKGRRQSRILWSYGHTTIPRHLRDVFVTEYGIAELRGKSDCDCVAAMLALADAEFQDALLARARQAGKIEDGFRMPAGRNTPSAVTRALEPARQAGWCEPFPFGSDFTPEERRLLPALALLREATATKGAAARTLVAALMPGPTGEGFRPELERMDLHDPRGLTERLSRRLLLWALGKASDRQAG